MTTPGLFLQTERWAKLQEALGRRVFWISGGAWKALLVRHELPFGKNYLYCPRGPIVVKHEAWNMKHEAATTEFLGEVSKIAKAEGSVFFRWDPPFGEGLGFRILDLGFPARVVRAVQPQHTLVVDLAKSEEDLLKEMHEKTRYNIRLAERKGVRIGNEELGIRNQGIETFWKLLQDTAKRDKFSVHPRAHYEKLLEIFVEYGRDKTAPFIRLYVAEHGGEPLAAAIVVFSDGVATYLHGASASVRREVMAPHLLHWRIMQDAKRLGCRMYDFWGISEKNPHWKGITRFKRGFGGEEFHFGDSLDVVFGRAWYAAYRSWRALFMMRRFPLFSSRGVPPALR